MHSFPTKRRYKILFLMSILQICRLCSGQEFPKINILFINEEGNKEAVKAMNDVFEFVNGSSSIGVTLYIEPIDGKKVEAKEFLGKLCETYSSMLDSELAPHIVFDTTKTPIMSEMAKSFTSTLDLPTVSSAFGQKGDIYQWRNISEEKQTYLLQVMPPEDIISEVIRSIAINTNMTNAAILFDETFVMDHKYKTLFRDIDINYVMTEIKMKSIFKLVSLNYTNFFIMGHLEMIKHVMENIPVDNFSNRYKWYGLTQELGNLSCCCGSFNMILIRPNNFLKRGYIEEMRSTTKYTEITSVFYFDLALRSILAVREMILANKWPQNLEYVTCDSFTESSSPNRSIDLKSFFVNVTEPATYGTFTFKDEVEFNGFSMLKFDMDILGVAVRNGIECNEKVLGNWTADFSSPFSMDSMKELSELNAIRVYRVSTVVKPPFIFRDSSAPKGYSGLSIDLMEVLAAIGKFDYVIKETNEHGNMLDDGRWTGIIGQLVENEADIGLGTLQRLEEREIAIDFTIPYYDTVGFMVILPFPKVSHHMFKFVRVLDVDVWICVFTAFFLSTTLLYVFDRWSPYSYRNNREKYGDEEYTQEFTIRECLWFVTTSITPQGCGEAPKNLSGRLVSATWWLFGFIVLASYTANLAAYLTVSRLEKPMMTMDDLAKQFKILYSTVRGSEAAAYFARMAEIEGHFYEAWKEISLNESLNYIERSKLAVWDYPVSDKYTKMWQAMQEAGLAENIEDATKRVLNTTNYHFAFIGDAWDVRYMLQTNCGIEILGDEFSKRPIALGVQKGSPLLHVLNKGLMHVVNENYLDKLNPKYWTRTIKCPKKEDKQDGIQFGNISGVFLIICLGIAMTFVMLIVETIYFRCLKNRNQPNVADDQDHNAADTNTYLS